MRLTERKLIAAADALDLAASRVSRQVTMLRGVTSNPKSRHAYFARRLAKHRDELREMLSVLRSSELSFRSAEGEPSMRDMQLWRDGLEVTAESFVRIAADLRSIGLEVGS